MNNSKPLVRILVGIGIIGMYVLKVYLKVGMVDTPTVNLMESLANEATYNGLVLLDEGKDSEALTYLMDSLTYAQDYIENPDNKGSSKGKVLLADSYNNLCMVYYKLGEYETSLKYGDLAAQIEPVSTYVYSNRGNSYIGLKRYKEGLDDYDKALEIDPSNSYALYGKILAHFKLYEYEEAIEAYDDKQIYSELLDDDISVYEYLIWSCFYIGDYDRGLEFSDKAINIMDIDNFEIYNGKGRNIYGKEGYEKAESFYKEIGNRFQQETEAQMLLGEFYYENGKYEQAEARFIEIQETYTDYRDAHYWLVSCYVARGEMELADALYKEIQNHGKVDAEFCNYIGNEFTTAEYYIESLPYFDEAIRLEPSNVNSYYNKLYSLYYGKRYTRAIKFGEASLKKFPKDYDIIMYIGESYYGLYEYETAIRWYKNALALKLESDTVRSYISDAYMMLDDYENSIKYADSALLYNKDNYLAKNIKVVVEQKQEPLVKKVKKFVEENYLYNDETSKYDSIFNKEVMTNEEINNALESIKYKDDLFTFSIYDDSYNEYYEYYMKDVEHQDLDDKQYIRIFDFNKNTYNQVIEILDEIDDPANTTLILDLRENGGGDTSAANNILDALLPSCVTCTLIYKNGHTYNYYSDASQIKFKEIYILVDDYSASASELLTLALKTYLNNVTIVGSNTYGKGVGQYVFEDIEAQLMVYVVNHFWNVRQQNIMDKGIEPDIYVESQNLSDYMDIIQ